MAFNHAIQFRSAAAAAVAMALSAFAMGGATSALADAHSDSNAATSVKNTVHSDAMAAASKAIQEQRYTDAVSILKPMVLKDDPEAQVMMGVLAFNGKGTAKDNELARQLFIEAIAHLPKNSENCRLAERMIGVTYLDQQDEDSAAIYFLTAASHGDLSSKQTLVERYNVTMRSDGEYGVLLKSAIAYERGVAENTRQEASRPQAGPADVIAGAILAGIDPQ